MLCSALLCSDVNCSHHRCKLSLDWHQIERAGQINWQKLGTLHGGFVTEACEKGKMGWAAMGGLKAWIGALLVCYCCVVDALRLEVPAHSTKCISDDIQSEVLTVGDYSVVSAADASHKVTCRVTSPSGKQLHYSENVQVGQFAFTTQESGNVMVCFWFQHAALGTTISVDLDWKTGVAAKDWADVAKKEKLDDMQVELRKLEDAVQSIHDEMLLLRQREEEMRDLNEATNARVAWFSIMSLFICLGVAGFQVWHLKSFFEKKKLL